MGLLGPHGPHVRPAVDAPGATSPAGPLHGPPPSPFYCRRRSPVSRGLTLGQAALVTSVLCGPVGLMLRLVALTRPSPPNSSDRVCAWVATGLGAVSFLRCVGGCVLNTLTSSAGT